MSDFTLGMLYPSTVDLNVFKSVTSVSSVDTRLASWGSVYVSPEDDDEPGFALRLATSALIVLTSDSSVVVLLPMFRDSIPETLAPMELT